MKKCLMILAILFLGFVSAGHNSSVPAVQHFTKTAACINETLEFKKNNTFDLKNIQTDISNTAYLSKNENTGSIHINNGTAYFIGFKKFILEKDATLTANSDFSSNPFKIRYQINPRAP